MILLCQGTLVQIILSFSCRVRDARKKTQAAMTWVLSLFGAVWIVRPVSQPASDLQFWGKKFVQQPLDQNLIRQRWPTSESVRYAS